VFFVKSYAERSSSSALTLGVSTLRSCCFRPRTVFDTSLLVAHQGRQPDVWREPVWTLMGICHFPLPAAAGERPDDLSNERYGPVAGPPGVCLVRSCARPLGAARRGLPILTKGGCVERRVRQPFASGVQLLRRRFFLLFRPL